MVDFNTKALHWGYIPGQHQKCLSPPIYQNTAFEFTSIEEAEALNTGKLFGHIYTRISNPTNEVLESKVSALEGGISSIACASGHAAQFLVISTLLQAGDHIVSSPYLYGGTFHQFKEQLPRLGISVDFADPNNPTQVASKINNKTKLIYAESLGNPELNPVNIEELATVAHTNNLPLVIDNTLGCCGYLIKPIRMGADIVISSLTKWAGGHGNAVGGIITDSGNFDWGNGTFPQFREENSAYKGLSFWDEYGFGGPGCQRNRIPFYKNIAFSTRLRLEHLRDWGPCISPFNSYLILQGIETLGLRVERACSNALAIAKVLSNHASVKNTRYPGLENDKYHSIANHIMTNGYGTIITFELKDGYDAAAMLVSSLLIFKHAANIGDSKSLVLHPASTTHSQLSEKEQLDSGVTPSMIRLSIGIEGEKDLIEDLEQGLNKICKIESKTSSAKP